MTSRAKRPKIILSWDMYVYQSVFAVEVLLSTPEENTVLVLVPLD